MGSPADGTVTVGAVGMAEATLRCATTCALVGAGMVGAAGGGWADELGAALAGEAGADAGGARHFG